MALKQFKFLSACLFVGLLSGCVNKVDEPLADDESTTPVTTTSNPDSVPNSDLGVIPESPGIIENQSTSEPIQPLSNNDVTPADEDNNNTPVTPPQFDQSSMVGNELGQSLLTDFALEDQRLVPTDGWICADSIGRSRIYYFYQQGVLDASRNVAIERTLNENGTFIDITFFWSVVADDGVLLTTVNRDVDGTLLSAGRQYDVSSIRFEEVDSVQTFTADSVLRGRLVCGNFALR